MRKLVAAFGALLLLTGCSIAKDIPRVDAAMARFHKQLNNQKFEDIYAGAGAEFRAASSHDDMVKLFSVIHRKLGDFQSGSDKGWNDNITTTGHYVTVTFAAKYAAGPAEESFVYRIDGEQALLVGYHINSMALLTN
jgi:hypothetical protein